MSPKRLVITSMVASGAIAVLSVVDMAIAIPFGRAFVLDIMFLVSAGIVCYLAYESLRELN